MKISVQRHYRPRQRGMGATVILFTIALIVLVGAALAYGSRGNSKVFTGESAKVMSSVLLKQSAEYRDAYNRYIFDGGVAANMLFTNAATVGLFNSDKQYGIQQDPPAKAFATITGPHLWGYNEKVVVTGVGSDIPATGYDSIVYVTGVAPEVCAQINTQLYGDPVIPEELSLADLSLTTTPTITSPSHTGRATGCIKLNSAGYAFYSTLAEN